MCYKRIDECEVFKYFNECEKRLNNKFSDKGVVKLYSIGFDGDLSSNDCVKVGLNDNYFDYYNQITVVGESYKENCDDHGERYCVPCGLLVNDEQICSYNRTGTYFGKYSHLHTHEAILYAEERVGISVYDVYEEFFSQFKKKFIDMKDYKILLYDILIEKDGIKLFDICWEYKGQEYLLKAFDDVDNKSKLYTKLNIDLNILFTLIGEDVLSRYKR